MYVLEHEMGVKLVAVNTKNGEPAIVEGMILKQVVISDRTVFATDIYLSRATINSTGT